MSGIIDFLEDKNVSDKTKVIELTTQKVVNLCNQFPIY